MRDLTGRQINRAIEILDLLDTLAREYSSTTQGRSMFDDHDARGEVVSIIERERPDIEEPGETFRYFLNSSHTPSVLGTHAESMADACWEVFGEEIESALDGMGLLDAPDCEEDFMAGTICSLRAGHDGPHGTICRECEEDWYSMGHATHCSRWVEPDEPVDDMAVVSTDMFDRLPVGTVAIDRDNFTIVRVSETEWFTPDGSGPNYFGHDEVRGDYSEDGSHFLPLRDVRLPA
jgi:hypothetical protein